MSLAPLRILIGLESSGPGGAENMVLSLAKGLRDRGHDPIIATNRPGWMTDRAEAAALPVWIETQRRALEIPWVLGLAWKLRRNRIDVFHSHEFSMNIFGGAAAWLARVPQVATIHGRHYVADAPRRIRAHRGLLGRGVPLVAVSDDLREYLAGAFDLDRDALRLVHNGIALPGVDLAGPRNPGTSDRGVRDELGLSPNAPLLLCVGNLYPVKDHASLVRTLPELPDATLAIAGRGEEEENLRRLARELGVENRLQLLGLRDDVDALLDAADVFVQPSKSEGLPLAVLEAMAHGVPVVASNVGGIPEAIVDGDSGLLVPPNDSSRLAMALAGLLAEPERARQLGQRGRERVAAEFSVGAMVDRYIELYERSSS